MDYFQYLIIFNKEQRIAILLRLQLPENNSYILYFTKESYIILKIVVIKYKKNNLLQESIAFIAIVVYLQLLYIRVKLKKNLQIEYTNF